MKDVVYVGMSDIRTISRADFEKMGVDHKGVIFPRRMPVEVSNEVCTTLTENSLVWREFAEATADNSIQPAPDVAPAGDESALVNDPEVVAVTLVPAFDQALLNAQADVDREEEAYQATKESEKPKNEDPPGDNDPHGKSGEGSSGDSGSSSKKSKEKAQASS